MWTRERQGEAVSGREGWREPGWWSSGVGGREGREGEVQGRDGLAGRWLGRRLGRRLGKGRKENGREDGWVGVWIWRWPGGEVEKAGRARCGEEPGWWGGVMGGSWGG